MIDSLVRKKGISFILIPLHLGLVIFSLFVFPHFTKRMGGTAGLEVSARYWLFYALSVAGSLGILGLFFFKSKPLFTASLFFLILLILEPFIRIQRGLLGFMFPGVDFILPFIVFFILLAVFPKMKNHITWLAWGKSGTNVWILLGGTIVFSVGALTAWFFILRPELGDLTGMIPSWPLPLLLLGGLGFAVSNAFAEEVFFRGMIRDGILSYAPIPAELLVTSGLFAAAHLNGFPRGVWGVGMAAIWGIVLGIIRNRSKGLLFPWIAHAAANLVIFALLLV